MRTAQHSNRIALELQLIFNGHGHSVAARCLALSGVFLLLSAGAVGTIKKLFLAFPAFRSYH